MPGLESSIRSYSDFAERKPIHYYAPKIYIKEILNEEVIVHDWLIKPSNKKEGELHMKLGCTIGDKEYSLWISSQLVISDIKKNVEKEIEKGENPFPFRIVFEKHKNIYIMK